MGHCVQDNCKHYEHTTGVCKWKPENQCNHYENRNCRTDECKHWDKVFNICALNPPTEAPPNKAKKATGKPRPTLVPPAIIWAIAKIRTWSTDKYPDLYNYKDVPIEMIRDAAFRHFLQYLEDPKSLDSESGQSHLAHAATNLAFLLEMEEEQKEEREA